MSELSPKARALLEAARKNHGPNEDERERVLAGLHVSLGIAGALPMLTDASPANATASGPQLAQPHAPSLPPPPPPVIAPQAAASKAFGWSKLAAWKAGKVYLATLVIGGSAVGVSMVPGADDDVQARRTAAMVAPQEAVAEAPVVEAAAIELPTIEEPAVDAPVEREVVERPTLERAAVEHAAVEPARASREVALREVASREVAPREVASREGQSAHVAARLSRSQARQENRRRARAEREILAQPPVALPVEEPKPVAPAQDLATAVGVGSPPSPELALIRAALTSLRDHDSNQALRLLDEHAARYPSGAFSTERRALHVVALCAAGRTDEGARERTQFLKASGDSPIAARVRSACPR